MEQVLPIAVQLTQVAPPRPQVVLPGLLQAGGVLVLQHP